MGSNRWMRKAVYVFDPTLFYLLSFFPLKTFANNVWILPVVVAEFSALNQINVNETPVPCHCIGEHTHHHFCKTANIDFFYEAI